MLALAMVLVACSGGSDEGIPYSFIINHDGNASGLEAIVKHDSELEYIGIKTDSGVNSAASNNVAGEVRISVFSLDGSDVGPIEVQFASSAAGAEARVVEGSLNVANANGIASQASDGIDLGGITLNAAMVNTALGDADSSGDFGISDVVKINDIAQSNTSSTDTEKIVSDIDGDQHVTFADAALANLMNVGLAPSGVVFQPRTLKGNANDNRLLLAWNRSEDAVDFDSASASGAALTRRTEGIDGFSAAYDVVLQSDGFVGIGDDFARVDVAGSNGGGGGPVEGVGYIENGNFVELSNDEIVAAAQEGRFVFKTWLENENGGINPNDFSGLPTDDEKEESANGNLIDGCHVQNIAAAFMGYRKSGDDTMFPVAGAQVIWQLENDLETWPVAPDFDGGNDVYRGGTESIIPSGAYPPGPGLPTVTGSGNQANFYAEGTMRLSAADGVIDNLQATTHTNAEDADNPEFPAGNVQFPTVNETGVPSADRDGFTWIALFSPDDYARRRIFVTASVNGTEIAKTFLTKEFFPKPVFEIEKELYDALKDNIVVPGENAAFKLNIRNDGCAQGVVKIRDFLRTDDVILAPDDPSDPHDDWSYWRLRNVTINDQGIPNPTPAGGARNPNPDPPGSSYDFTDPLITVNNVEDVYRIPSMFADRFVDDDEFINGDDQDYLGLRARDYGQRGSPQVFDRENWDDYLDLYPGFIASRFFGPFSGFAGLNDWAAFRQTRIGVDSRELPIRAGTFLLDTEIYDSIHERNSDIAEFDEAFLDGQDILTVAGAIYDAYGAVWGNNLTDIDLETGTFSDGDYEGFDFFANIPSGASLELIFAGEADRANDQYCNLAYLFPLTAREYDYPDVRFTYDRDRIERRFFNGVDISQRQGGATGFGFLDIEYSERNERTKIACFQVQEPVLEVEKKFVDGNRRVDNLTVSRGDHAVAEITVRNNSDHIARNLSVRDVLQGGREAGYRVVSVSAVVLNEEDPNNSQGGAIADYLCPRPAPNNADGFDDSGDCFFDSLPSDERFGYDGEVADSNSDGTLDFAEGPIDAYDGDLDEDDGLTYIGDLEPGEAIRYTLTVRITEDGQFCNTARAYYDVTQVSRLRNHREFDGRFSESHDRHIALDVACVGTTSLAIDKTNYEFNQSVFESGNFNNATEIFDVELGQQYISFVRVENRSGGVTAEDVLLSDILAQAEPAGTWVDYVDSRFYGPFYDDEPGVFEVDPDGSDPDNLDDRREVIAPKTIDIPAGRTATFAVVSQIPDSGFPAQQACDVARYTSSNAGTDTDSDCVRVTSNVAVAGDIYDDEFIPTTEYNQGDVFELRTDFVNENSSNEALVGHQLDFTFGRAPGGSGGTFDILSTKVYKVNDSDIDTNGNVASLPAPLVAGTDYSIQAAGTGRQRVSISVVLNPGEAFFIVNDVRATLGGNVIYTSEYDYRGRGRDSSALKVNAPAGSEGTTVK